MMELIGYDNNSKKIYCRITSGMCISFDSGFEEFSDSINIKVFESKPDIDIRRSDSNPISDDEYNTLFSQLTNNEKVVLSDEYIIELGY